jgi:hypothetical protein
VSHPHHHSAWHRTELPRWYTNTGMMEMDCVTGENVNTEVTEIDRAMGSIYSGNPGVDRQYLILYLISAYFISSYYTTHYTLYCSHLLLSLTLSEIRWIHTECQKEQVLSKDGKDRVCNLLYNEMR